MRCQLTRVGNIRTAMEAHRQIASARATPNDAMVRFAIWSVFPALLTNKIGFFIILVGAVCNDLQTFYDLQTFNDSVCLIIINFSLCGLRLFVIKRIYL